MFLHVNSYILKIILWSCHGTVETNLTSNHEVVGLIPGLCHKNPACVREETMYTNYRYTILRNYLKLTSL